MGPFVPEIISDQLNLVVALILGIGFGFVLEQAGFSSSRRLAGLFYGYDFTVLRVFFTAAVTAMSGVLLLGYFGLLDTDAIFVNPTWLLPAIVGGAIMGSGFILGGYCPGTSVCAAAIGKVDALFFVGGGLLGVFGFAEAYPLIHDFNDSTSLGSIKVFDSIGVSQGLFAFILIVVAVVAFAITTILEKRVNKTAAPSLTFKKRNHIAAGLAICALGVLFIFMPDRKTHMLNNVSDPAYLRAHPVKYMDEDELAFRIVDHEPNIQMIDLRPAEAYSKFSLPGSVNIQPRDLFSKEWSLILSRRHVKKVVIGDDDSQEQSACLLLQDLGYENVTALKGGIRAFRTNILNSSNYIATGTRWDSDVARFRASARNEILKMIEDQKKTGSRAVKVEKKIQGGC